MAIPSEARGIHQSDLIIRSAIIAALDDIRANPWLLDYAFASLPKDNLTAREYGQREIDNAKKWFLNTKIKVFMSTALSEPQFPCISITLVDSGEAETTLADVHYVPQQDEDRLWPALTDFFTPDSYDQATGTLVLPPSVTLVLAPGQQVIDATGKAHEILDVPDDLTVVLKPGFGDFSRAVIKGKKPSSIVSWESVRMKETYSLGCHVQGEQVHLTYLHSLLVFALYRYKATLLEARGYERTTVASTDFRRNPDFDVENTFSRHISISGYVTQVWPTEVNPKVTAMAAKIAIADSGHLPPDTDPAKALWVGDEDLLDGDALGGLSDTQMDKLLATTGSSVAAPKAATDTWVQTTLSQATQDIDALQASIQTETNARVTAISGLDARLSTVEAGYVTLGGAQTIAGAKTFSAGITSGGKLALTGIASGANAIEMTVGNRLQLGNNARYIYDRNDGWIAVAGSFAVSGNISSDGGSVTAAVRMSTPRYEATAASGNNALTINQGARLDSGAGAQYIESLATGWRLGGTGTGCGLFLGGPSLISGERGFIGDDSTARMFFEPSSVAGKGGAVHLVGRNAVDAAAIGVILDTDRAQTVAGALIASLRNGNVEKVRFDKDGIQRFMALPSGAYALEFDGTNDGHLAQWFRSNGTQRAFIKHVASASQDTIQIGGAGGNGSGTYVRADNGYYVGTSGEVLWNNQGFSASSQSARVNLLNTQAGLTTTIRTNTANGQSGVIIGTSQADAGLNSTCILLDVQSAIGGTPVSKFTISADGGATASNYLAAPVMWIGSNTANGEVRQGGLSTVGVRIRGGTNITADCAVFAKGTGSDKARIDTDGQYENLTSGKGIVLKSPNGTRYLITVSDAGALVVTPA